MTNLKRIWCENNLFTFEDIESNIGLPSIEFNYIPQANIGEEQSIQLDIGDHYNMNVVCGGTHNQYQWYKNSQPIPGEQTATYSISNATLLDAGDYNCQITNTVATDLIIFSNPIHISIYDPAIVTDSLALVAFYNATGGPNWTNHDNWLAGPLNSWYGVTIELGRVKGLDLFSNNLTGNLPQDIGNLTKLNTLYLGNNSISGTLPAEFGNLTDLTGLDLCANPFTGDLPPGFYSLQNLNYLYLSGTGFTNIDMSAISQMSKLATIYFSSLNLSGNIPVSLFSLPALVSLTLSDNNFTGEIPAEAWTKTSLYHLNLSGNQLTGEIPGEIGNMTNLQGLILSNNQLTGAIPSSINQTYLRWLDLSNNQFTDLPDLSGLSDLQGLWIYGNRFSFEDIEPNIGVPSSYFYYAPQMNIGECNYVTLDMGDNYTCMSFRRQQQQYQWYKNGGPYLPLIQTSLFLQMSDASSGSDTCQVTNTVATDLTYFHILFIFCLWSGDCLRFTRSGGPVQRHRRAQLDQPR